MIKRTLLSSLTLASVTLTSNAAITITEVAANSFLAPDSGTDGNFFELLGNYRRISLTAGAASAIDWNVDVIQDGETFSGGASTSSQPYLVEFSGGFTYANGAEAGTNFIRGRTSSSAFDNIILEIDLKAIGVGGDTFVRYFYDDAPTGNLTLAAAQAVPEPSSALLATAGLCLLAFRRKRKA